MFSYTKWEVILAWSLCLLQRGHYQVLHLLFAIIAVVSPSAEAAGRPNIVFILADDLGYGDLGCYGQKKIKTPRLDRMAKEGIRFTSHYSGYNICSPSRCILMTGKHMGHASVTGNGGRLKKSDITVPMLLKGAGYKTCMIGKWGLVGRPGHPGSPNNKGFDHFFGFDNQGFAHFYYPEYLWRNDQKVLYPKNHNLRVKGEYKKGEGTFSHDELTREAIGWIRENRDRPFFLYLPFCIPHAELTVPEDSMAPYLKLGWKESPKIEGKGNIGGGRKDAGYGSQYKTGYCGQSYPNAAYAGMISRMDRSIGQILDLLDELKLSQNTLVIFSSDNGPSSEGGQSLKFFQSSGPLRGAKRSVWEGGIRVPMIARWPGRIKPGRTSDRPSAFWDFLPTACELAGVKPPPEIDGISYLPELLGQTGAQKKHKFLYWTWAIRVGKWKMHRRGKNRYALYNLEEDLAEAHDVAAGHSELVARYSKYFDEAR
ncbi:MAG: arylsulfatase, partial [Planctomycetota bacterium]|nr:arylsulfatase [Planctomycetota bacterium]